jgi:hypothetical protein
MPARDRLSADERDQSDDAPTEHLELPVTTHRTTPDRCVFTESGNTDAWISTDTTVDLER